MALVSENVRIGATGALYVAPRGTALPTTATMALDAAFIDLGFLGEPPTEAPEEDTSAIQAWQGSVIVRRTTTSYEHRYNLLLIETKRETLELYYKGSVVESDGATGHKLEVRTPTADRRSFVLDVVDGDTIIRNVIPDGEVAERGEITYGQEDAVGYQVTLTAYPTPTGILVAKYSDDPAWEEAS